MADTSPNQKTGIESLSKDELLKKYKGVLNLAKLAKQAKDELAVENRSLKEALQHCEAQKEADKKALVTMKETLEEFTQQKLELSTEVQEQHERSRSDGAELERLRIENESLRRQMDSLTTDNETLLNDIDAMEDQLKKVNLIGIEQKKHLELLELELNCFKEQACNDVSSEETLNVSSKENEALKKALEELTQKYKSVKEINSEQRHKFNALKDRFVDIYRKLKKLKECKSVLLETQHEYAASVTKWQNDIIQASRRLCAQMHALQSENVELQKKLKSREEESTGTTGSNIEGSLNIEYITRKLQELSSLSNDAIKEHEEQVRLTENEHKKTMIELEVQKTENRSLTQEISDLKAKLQENDQILYSVQENQLSNMEQLKRDNMEMQQNLSLQEEKYENVKFELEKLIDRFSMKERQHTDLLGEMRELNEALKGRGDLISRQEEKLKQLKTLETSLKDKDKLLLLKEDEIKKLQTEIEVSATKVKELESNVERSKEHIAALSEELQSLRQSGHNTYDVQSDVVSLTSSVSRAEEINRELDENNEERYNKLRKLAMKMKKKLQKQIAETNELTQQKEVLQTEYNDCKDRVKNLKLLNETLKAENKKLKSSRKQSNVLSLEIEAAERSLSEVSTKLNAKTDELKELKAVLDTKESNISQLRTQIAILEASKASECEHGKELKAQIDKLQSQIKDTLHAKQAALDKSKDLEYAQERLQLEVEDLKLQLAQSTRKHEAIHSELNTENTQLNSKLQEMESALATTQATLQSTTRSLEDMRVEYLEYKVKAQAVLRKNQTKDHTLERELENELMTVRNKSQQLETHAKMLSDKLKETEQKLDNLEDDYKSSMQRSDELQKLIEELRLENDSLMQEQRILMQAQQDSLRQQRQQLEKAETCHRDEMENLERNYQRQIEQLKTELNKLSRQPTINGGVAKISPMIQSLLHSDLVQMEREDAEGSEEATNASLAALAAKRKISNASSSRRSLHEFMPLDELLNAPMKSLNSETILNASNFPMDSAHFDDGVNANFTADSAEHFELLAAKELLQKQESRVRHLTALLAENEQDLAKLTQMNDMLKEELRRQERSVEREQHMHNSEYLKNVFIKFITLNSVDERTRLVPVLNTILKLSRTEMEMLNCVAKGQKVSESNTRSWSNFLPSWGGGGGGGGGGNSGN